VYSTRSVYFISLSSGYFCSDIISVNTIVPIPTVDVCFFILYWGRVFEAISMHFIVKYACVSIRKHSVI